MDFANRFCPFLLAVALCSMSCTSSDFVRRSVEERSLPEDSVAMDVRLARTVWKDAAWAGEYDRNIFQEYVFPPQVADEPVEYRWREDIPRWLSPDIGPEDDLITAARKINAAVDVPVKPETWGNPQMGYSKTMTGAFGKCDDRAILLAMALRSYGIPAAFEYVPNWGRKNNGHSFCSVILPSDSLLVFQDRKDDGENVSYSDLPPKVYRRTFFMQKDNPVYRRRGKEPVPRQFEDCRFKDVTGYHQIAQTDVRVDIPAKKRNRIAYLAVFTPQGWEPVAFAEIRNGRAVFEDVGADILYLPCLYENTGPVPAGAPVIVRQDSIEKILPGDGTETVTLTRKYPRTERIIRFAGYMDGGMFEAANREDFSDAVQLFRVDGIPLSRMQTENIDQSDCYRYVRYRKPSGVFSIGEMQFRDRAGHILGGRIILPRGLERLPGAGNATDGQTLTYVELTGLADVWIGLDFGRPEEIGSVEFCPRTDDNDISPGDEYELLFWNDGWESLGIRTADDYELTFENVPSGALLWLRDITRGREERPFLYKDGRQIWL